MFWKYIFLQGGTLKNEEFYTIPDLEEECDLLDPRTRNPQSFANTISLNGPNAAIEHVKRGTPVATHKLASTAWPSRAQPADGEVQNHSLK